MQELKPIKCAVRTESCCNGYMGPRWKAVRREAWRISRPDLLDGFFQSAGKAASQITKEFLTC